MRDTPYCGALDSSSPAGLVYVEARRALRVKWHLSVLVLTLAASHAIARVAESGDGKGFRLDTHR